MIVPLVGEAAAFPSRQPARFPAEASQTKCSGNLQRNHRVGRIAQAFAAIFRDADREVIRAPRAVPLLLEYPFMDLLTLVATCVLTVDPKLMHALIWHQSGGEPWSFSAPGERQRYVYRSAPEAVAEAHRSAPTDLPIRVGLTGLAVDSGSATSAMVMPCPNISITARQITQLIDRRKITPRYTAHSIHCAIAAYGGSWDRPDNKFADAVLTSEATGDAPNFDMPDDIGHHPDGVAAEPSVAGQRTSTARSAAPDDQQQGWSSALFSARWGQFDATRSSSPDADWPQESSTMTARPIAMPSMTIACSCADCPSGGRNDRFERGSHDFAWCRTFGMEAWGLEVDRPRDGKIKAPPSVRRKRLVGLSNFANRRTPLPALPINTPNISTRSPPSSNLRKGGQP
jgi:hypothetical protein